tara:strand:+ start:326 stop:505 length:180 start_codon:yes stop_codon:yes gene_type:complete
MLTDFLAISTTVVADSGVTDVPPEVQLRTRKRPENVEIAALEAVFPPLNIFVEDFVSEP